MELTNRITVAQVGRSGADAPTAEERAEIEQWASRLGAAQLHRLWQLLLKGYDEVRTAPDPLVAAQMALLRVMHAADMPDPGTLAKKLEDMLANGVAVPAPASDAVSAGGTPSGGPTAQAPAMGWEALVDRVDRAGYLRVAQIMRDWVRVIELAPGRLVYSLVPGLSLDPAADIRDALLKATGDRWEIQTGESEGAPSLREREVAAKEAASAAMRRDPLVEAAFAAFPQAEIVEEAAAPGGHGRNYIRRA